MSPREPTGAQIGAAIDHGRAADKVDYPDPAAAPLTTDAEAAGKPPTPGELRLAASRLGRRPMVALSDDVGGLVAYAAVTVPLALLILMVVALAR